MYVKESLQAYKEVFNSWSGYVETGLTSQDAELEKLKDYLINSEKISTSIPPSWRILYTTIHDWHASQCESQTYENTQCKPDPLVPPTPPTDKANHELKKIWAAIQELKAPNRQQASHEAQASLPPTPDPYIAILTNQMKEIQAELYELPAARAPINPSPPHSEEGGYFPGLEGCSKIFCGIALTNFAQEVRELAHNMMS
ncbi:hypothetical protein DSO57_1031557 [Entomophthora muscae]|uniref:Uncharacterized protein n=1 Tax=Entomophthora muscae TaxID=34485 RepID=A0ACC2SPL5_9FUNG|nr:hypothetical protein DSO57_1031557 [Entomophthora muscae]